MVLWGPPCDCLQWIISCIVWWLMYIVKSKVLYCYWTHVHNSLWCALDAITSRRVCMYPSVALKCSLLAGWQVTNNAEVWQRGGYTSQSLPWYSFLHCWASLVWLNSIAQAKCKAVAPGKGNFGSRGGCLHKDSSILQSNLWGVCALNGLKWLLKGGSIYLTHQVFETKLGQTCGQVCKLVGQKVVH